MPRVIPPAGRAEAGAARTLTLLVPGLTGAGLGVASRPDRPELLLEGLDAGVVERLLARADRVAGGGAGTQATLRAMFGWPGDETGAADADFPIAALTLYADSGERPDGYWLRADPVHIETGQDRLIMTGGAGLAIDADEAAALCADINAHLTDEGLRLVAPAPARWYFRWPEPPALCFAPLAEVIGGDLYPHMPGGEAGRDWRRRLNEIQMLLHAHPVNEARRVQRRPGISGVWIWGGGELPAPRPCGFTGVWSDDPLVRGLALHAGLVPAPAPAPSGAEAWLAAAGPGAHLVCPCDLEEPLRLGALEDWRAGLAALQRDWIAPLEQAVRGGALRSLVVSAATGYGYHVARRGLRRWWRRPRPLTGYR